MAAFDAMIAMGTGETNTWLLILLGLGALLSAARLAGMRRSEAADWHFGGRESDLAHLVMNATMALMLGLPQSKPWAGWIVRAYWLLALSWGAMIALALARGGPQERPAQRFKIGALGYHLFAIAAMIYAMHVVPAATGMRMSATAAGPGVGAWVLAAAFLLDAVATLTAVMVFPRATLAWSRTLMAARSAEADGSVLVGGGDARAPGQLAELRLAAVPHLIMDFGMTFMLLMASRG